MGNNIKVVASTVSKALPGKELVTRKQLLCFQEFSFSDKFGRKLAEKLQNWGIGLANWNTRHVAGMISVHKKVPILCSLKKKGSENSGRLLRSNLEPR